MTSGQRLAGGHSFRPLLMPMSEAFSISFNKTLLQISLNLNTLQTYTDFQIAFLKYFGEISYHYPSGKLWNFFKNTKFTISRIISSQPIPQAEVFLHKWD